MSTHRALEPVDGDERAVVLGWLHFHRDALEAKIGSVADDDLIRSGLGGSTMSLLGLVRHLTEMERVYAVHALGGGSLEFLYGPYVDGGPDGDFDDLTVEMVDASIGAWRAERAAADALFATMAFDERGRGNGRTMRWNVVKLFQEYARHNGHADLIRQSIDGGIGE